MIANYQNDYRSLEDAQRLSGATEEFQAQMGVVFSRLIPKRPSINNRFSGRRRLCHPSCRCAEMDSSRDVRTI